MANSVSYGLTEPAAASAPPVEADCPPKHGLSGLGGLLGASPIMQEVFHLIEKVGPTGASVLLTGECGSGKEFAARMVHACSPRHHGPFVVVNCGAIPAGLLEAELFGNEKGGLSSATQAHAGAFERANGGTLLLDEITEMPPDIQSRLLRALKSKRFYRVGASTGRSADVRVIAAANRCPVSAVRGGQLREDLLYRLAVFPIEMPPLRARTDDAELLAESFLDELNVRTRAQKRLSALSRMTLRQHAWPGNVRELKNCIERAYILADSVLELSPLVQSASRSEPAPGMASAADQGRLDIRVGTRIHDMERSLIEATLNHYKGNKRRAADVLGCSLKTLYNKLNGYSQSQECANT